MERKTKVHAPEGSQEILITREFELPVDLVFRAHSEADIIEQWMGTKVLKLDLKNHGGWQYETRDPQGNVVFRANGVFHEVVPNKRIVRTFEMENVGFGAQIEFIEFEELTADTSLLKIHSIYRSTELRNQVLKMPFEYGINMAHDRLVEVVSNLK